VKAALLDSGAHSICVLDTVISMASDEIDHALSEFGRVDSVMICDQDGVGLGLPLTRSLVEPHGGEMWVESEKGGTRVCVSFFRERVISPSS